MNEPAQTAERADCRLIFPLATGGELKPHTPTRPEPASPAEPQHRRRWKLATRPAEGVDERARGTE